MTKSRTQPALQVAGAVHNTTTILARRVAELGGNYTEALVRIGMGEKQHDKDIEKLAAIYASISKQPPCLAVPASARKGVIAPEGGRIHIVHVLVDESLEWDSAINAGFPDTPVNYDVRKVSGLYPANRAMKVVEREIILANFGDIPNTDSAVAWGKANSLLSASPRTVFALGKHRPWLHSELGQNVLVVVSPEECTFSSVRRVPRGWWRGGRREASLRWPDGSFGGRCWFAFVRE